MPKSHRLNKSHNCAVVTLDGRNYDLGPKDSPKGHGKYVRLIAEWRLPAKHLLPMTGSRRPDSTLAGVRVRRDATRASGLGGRMPPRAGPSAAFNPVGTSASSKRRTSLASQPAAANFGWPLSRSAAGCGGCHGCCGNEQGERQLPGYGIPERRGDAQRHSVCRSGQDDRAIGPSPWSVLDTSNPRTHCRRSTRSDSVMSTLASLPVNAQRSLSTGKWMRTTCDFSTFVPLDANDLPGHLGESPP